MLASRSQAESGSGTIRNQDIGVAIPTSSSVQCSAGAPATGEALNREISDRYWDIPKFRKLKDGHWTLTGYYRDNQNVPELLGVLQRMLNEGTRDLPSMVLSPRRCWRSSRYGAPHFALQLRHPIRVGEVKNHEKAPAHGQQNIPLKVPCIARTFHVIPGPGLTSRWSLSIGSSWLETSLFLGRRRRTLHSPGRMRFGS